MVFVVMVHFVRWCGSVVMYGCGLWWCYVVSCGVVCDGVVMVLCGDGACCVMWCGLCCVEGGVVCVVVV